MRDPNGLHHDRRHGQQPGPWWSDPDVVRVVPVSAALLAGGVTLLVQDPGAVAASLGCLVAGSTMFAWGLHRARSLRPARAVVRRRRD